jgi:hypothetical protein
MMNSHNFAKKGAAECRKKSEGTISLALLPYVKGLFKKREVREHIRQIEHNFFSRMNNYQIKYAKLTY